jgi:membrane protein
MTKGWTIFKNAIISWNEDNVSQLAAALAYYTAFSLAPFLVICIGVTGLLMSKQSAQAQILLQIGSIVGDKSADQLQLMIDNISKPSTNIIATIVGISLFIFGMTGVFNHLSGGLNTIWGVRARAQNTLWHTIQNKFLSFTTILGVAFIFLVSLVASTVIMAGSEYLSSRLPGFEVIWILLNFFISFVLTFGLFALVFKTLPDVLIEWKHIWVGAFVTAVLFVLGKFTLEFYLSHNDIGSVYGAAGSLIVILVWVYYSSQILFFGAEFTKAYTLASGKKIVAGENYMLVTYKLK